MKPDPADHGPDRSAPATVGGSVSTTLPIGARTLLVKAAMVDPNVEWTLSLKRRIAVDAAIDQVKLMYPHFFLKS